MCIMIIYLNQKNRDKKNPPKAMQLNFKIFNFPQICSSSNPWPLVPPPWIKTQKPCLVCVCSV